MPQVQDAAYRVLVDQLRDRDVEVDRVETALKAQQIETPSWGYGNTGTRFMVFKEQGAARDSHERLADAAQVHRLTGVCPSVAIHIPWDEVDDYDALKAAAAALGVRIGAVNPNVFQDYEYKYGSLGNANPAYRRKALDHILHCVDIMTAVDSPVLSLWFADGTDYPGQGDFRRRKGWFEEGLAEVYRALPERTRMLIEYKFFEPAFYHTDIADWGMAYAFARRLGPKAQVLVDLGHHPSGTNIPHIVAFLIDEGKLGGFHFNDRKYADDDLTTGSVNPYEIFLIFCELVAAANDPSVAPDIAYMVDQSHITKPKIEAMLQTVMNIQTAYAKALLVDRAALQAAQEAEDTILCERLLQEAFNTDVTPLLAKVRAAMGCDPDPIMAHRASGYQETIRRERAGELQGARSWG
ncbi:MAG: L-rhamnose isomerase [Candidatus Latescibacteria bacterium]|nr:L-rhamnose isomerase [Candidatus Latescibacterota bacterium]